MTPFVLFASVPAFLFCCIALVHFQQEIWKTDGAGLTVSKKITLDSQNDATPESDLCTLRSGSPSQDEVYHLESAYLGPFFLVQTNDGGGWQLTSACDVHHRMTQWRERDRHSLRSL
jgi:hypothetical protein